MTAYRFILTFKYDNVLKLARSRVFQTLLDVTSIIGSQPVKGILPIKGSQTQCYQTIPSPIPQTSSY